MPEYTYLLETRLTVAQQNALVQVRDAAREAGMVVFLTGGAVRDLTTGSSVRDLDFSVQGNALELQAAVEARGATLWGKHEPSRTLLLWFPGSVRVELTSTRAEQFPKPGHPEYTWAGIVDDLFRRDFTANAMALSLNEGSYGLLLDPLNGVADTEARQLRLVSNYGFLEDPSRLLRAARLRLRLGWTMEERTEARYQNAREADNFDAISAFHRGYELEEIAAEEDALAIIEALESEGWMSKLIPGWSSAHADAAALDSLHRSRIQLLMQGISPDLTAAHFYLLTAKMSSEARKALKALMVRPGLLAQWEGLDVAAKEFARVLTGREMNAPSATWKLFHDYAAEPVLWLAHTGKGTGEAKFKQLFTVWPEIAKKIPVTLMTELRITPDLPAYPELLHELFLQQIDGKLQSDEEMRAFLETYSPPAPPPPVSLKRSRTKKSEAKGKRKGAAADTDRDTDRDTDLDAEEMEEDLDKVETGNGQPGNGHVEEEESEEEEPAVDAVKVAPEPRKKKPGAGAVNLEGVDLGAVLQRIQGEGGGAKKAPRQPVSEPTAKKPADKGEPAAPVSGHKAPGAEPKAAVAKTTPEKSATSPRPAVPAPAKAAPSKAATAAAEKPAHGPAKAAAKSSNAAVKKAAAKNAALAVKASAKTAAPVKSVAGKKAAGKTAAPAKAAKAPVQRPAARAVVPAKKAAPGKGAPAAKKKAVASAPAKKKTAARQGRPQPKPAAKKAATPARKR